MNSNTTFCILQMSHTLAVKFWTGIGQRKSEVYILVETHLDPQQHQQTCQYFTIRGQHSIWHPSPFRMKATPAPMAASLVLGDVFLWPDRPWKPTPTNGCGYQAFLWQATDLTILVAGTYLKTGETLQSEVNATILARLLGTWYRPQITLLCSWVIGRTIQAPSASTVLPSKFHFEVLWLQMSACFSGNVIDYALIHNQLGQAPLRSLLNGPFLGGHMHSSHITSTSKKPPKNTGRFSNFHHYQPHRTLTSGLGPHTSPLPTSLTSMATQPNDTAQAVG